PDDDTPVAGPAELNQRLIESGKVEACLASHFFAFASRRTLEASSRDECAAEDLTGALKDQEIGLAGAFMRLAQYSSFFVRKVGPRCERLVPEGRCRAACSCVARAAPCSRCPCSNRCCPRVRRRPPRPRPSASSSSSRSARSSSRRG